MTGDLGVLIADDEHLVRASLRDILDDEPGVRILGEAADGRATLERIEELRPDLVFLDIVMPEMDGLDVAHALSGPGRPGIVFVTAHDRFAVEAFDRQAIDYVLKPFDDIRVRSALSRARERLTRGSDADLVTRLESVVRRLTRGRGRERFVVRVGAKIVIVNAESVDWVEAADNYVRLHTSGGRHVVRGTMRTLAAELPGFVRIHRSVLVNVARVSGMTALPGGDYEVLLRSGGRLRLSRRYVREFERQVGYIA
jgi:two-component system LytT family response regulator